MDYKFETMFNIGFYRVYMRVNYINGKLSPPIIKAKNEFQIDVSPSKTFSKEELRRLDEAIKAELINIESSL